ncbi:IS66 family transposase [Desulfococcus multivorans]|uniref:Transposase IS66 n=2 Tax=Desulfococcus multivorans TaxID=897 RepID=S7TSI0_DESML|nr:IS66 family transposase [Desulfococcus multivorans]AOY59045.1 transposase, IS66 family [Desulfococcus multivorans]AOY59698.1 transposase, IS66 family [Desulfococcus multivorans]AOY60469.1 putative transposase IS66 family [Desulfococcus multivorans]AQV01300.1 IS66 family transposase [Desulfococcus multivorans]AQV01879.1 IS66 family transposase [Desulfococcus multivorans]
MKLNAIDVEETVKNTRRLLGEDQNVSPALKAAVELLLLLVALLLNRLGLNSSNSSKPPASDPNRKKKEKAPGANKRGGQPGHNGTTLKRVEKPDVIKDIPLDPATLPKGNYKEAGYDARQVIDIDISQIVTEYRAQILEDANGKRYTAPFPEGVNRPVQYGINLKAHSVYLSQYQLIPYNRIEETFLDQAGIPVGGGSIFNFNEEAYEKLEAFDAIARSKLINSDVCHADETGINIDGKRRWLHCVSNDDWTYFLPHEKRGVDAMNEMGILPNFHGILCHDHWKPYFKFDCEHALCNAHHLRELQRAWEQDHQEWARDTRALLLEINKAVDDAGGQLTPGASLEFRLRYRKLLEEAQKECPPPDESQKNGKRGRLKRSKARNLLERLIDYENETLRFMDDERVPFTNNQGENDIRMTKVQQKISGCFRSMKGAAIFCRVRSYLSTCRKHGVRASIALRLLFEGKLPDFLNE